MEDELIVGMMPIASIIGGKYAKKNGKYPPEAVAEAYYQLTKIVKTKYPLLEKLETDDDRTRYLVRSISRGVNKYFRYNGGKERLDNNLRPANYSEEEMIDWLEQWFPVDTWIYEKLRDGLSFEDIELINKEMARTKKIKYVVKKYHERIKRLLKIETLAD